MTDQRDSVTAPLATAPAPRLGDGVKDLTDTVDETADGLLP